MQHLLRPLSASWAFSCSFFPLSVMYHLRSVVAVEARSTRFVFEGRLRLYNSAGPASDPTFIGVEGHGWSGLVRRCVRVGSFPCRPFQHPSSPYMSSEQGKAGHDKMAYGVFRPCAFGSALFYAAFSKGWMTGGNLERSKDGRCGGNSLSEEVDGEIL
ncbi:uncharacterized protein B0T15DRAFT_128764 [Chaetomium strumarium]|uniref:Uncharacterized protein n=1 Tax=Chaetomium strumarium TaxID=1170767 RepID=A0AAJ0M4T3_9PEZI|nr:hypothetical protein B0T15DRAFT_128764 [Chaetomium strumarium]